MSQIVTVIRAKNQSFGDTLKEFWEYRELLYMLTLRRISVRYKQTIVGIAWVLIQPLIAMTIFNVIFGKLVKIPSKVYFPRLMIPFSAVASAWVDFAISLFLLLPLTFIYGLRPTWSLLLIPVVMVITMILTTGLGVFLAAMNVRYRDFQYLVPFLVQVLLYASPVVYSIEIVPPHLHFWYYLNPLAGLLDMFRFAVTGQTTYSWLGFGWSVISSLIFFGLGIWVFRSVERGFADYV
jgi:lipopolysaccharide transport system permease protein